MVAADGTRLRGRLCATVSEAATVGQSASGWEFVAMSCTLENAELQRLCDIVTVPVFARDMEPGAAWSCGVSGINRIAL